MRFWMPLLRRPWYLSNRVEFTDNLTGGEVEQLVSDSEIRVLQCSSPVETDTWDLLNLNLFTRRPEIELRVYYQYCPNVEFENSFKCMSGRKLSAKMSKIDLKSDIPLGGCEDSPGGMHEHWPDDFRSTDGPASADRVSPLRGALRWRLQGAAFLLPRSISLFGFCPTHLSRELARHRNLLARALATTLPHGISRWHLAQQSGPRQPAARLAHLCRLCSRAHGAGARPLSGRTFRGGIGRHGLRFRFHHRRFVPVPFSLGAVPAAQERGQNPHLAGSARAHPGQCYVTGGQVNDVNLLDQLGLEAGAIYLLDRGYIDYRRLFLITQALAFFVTRADQNMRYRYREGRPVDRSTGLRSDQTIRLTGPKSSRRYPVPLRRIHYFDAEKDLRLVFLTNNFQLQALTIAQLYRARWQVELFFRWIKQHLRLRAFYGTSENAVKTQVWVAIAVYVLVAILKKQLHLDLSLYKTLQILSVTIFEKTPILLAFSQYSNQLQDPDPCTQLDLFNL